LPGFCIAVVPLLHVLKTWLLQGLSWLLPWAHKLCAFLLCQTTCLSASSTCLHTHMHTHCYPFQVEHVWSCLVLLIFSSPQARVLNVCNHACMNMQT
jgi:hypothetical protein